VRRVNSLDPICRQRSDDSQTNIVAFAHAPCVRILLARNLRNKLCGRVTRSNWQSKDDRWNLECLSALAFDLMTGVFRSYLVFLPTSVATHWHDVQA
jgi:hypothetical protein